MLIKRHTILKLIIFIILYYSSVQSSAQVSDSDMLNIGDPAPKLQVSKWLKGTPIQSFEPGKLYAIEFWATWCKPCIASMAHLSEFAKNHTHEISIIAIAVGEKNTPLEKIKRFVDSMGNRMNFSVAIDKDEFMEKKWLQACGNRGIPKTFIVNGNGQIAWFGHPYYFEQVATTIMKGQWDIQKASAEIKMKRHLDEFVDSIRKDFFDYSFVMSDSEINVLQTQYQVTNLLANTKKPDTVLFYMNKLIQQEPGIQYYDFIVHKKLRALFQINKHEALEYVKELLNLPPDKVPARAIIYELNEYKSKNILPKEMYSLGAEVYNIYIHQIIFPELEHTPKYYHEMAEWYWSANNKDKAVEAEKTAIRILQNHSDFTLSTLTAYKNQLEFYEKNNGQ